ncbi:MAG: hypothetical protein IPN58_15825 [Anaerolineales bacterium]|nr:hypothetical protein [Anaerolineales bacterium]
MNESADQLSERVREVQSLTVQVAETVKIVDAISKQLNEREKVLQALNTKLLEIYYSRAWRIIQLLWKIRLSSYRQ